MWRVLLCLCGLAIVYAQNWCVASAYFLVLFVLLCFIIFLRHSLSLLSLSFDHLCAQFVCVTSFISICSTLASAVAAGGCETIVAEGLTRQIVAQMRANGYSFSSLANMPDIVLGQSCQPYLQSEVLNGTFTHIYHMVSWFLRVCRMFR
jgi:hypothetical protein